MSLDTFNHTMPFVTHDHVAEKNAWVAAARGRNHRALLYRRWAEEYAAAGRLDDYRRCIKEATASRARALDALSLARLEASYG